MQNVMNMQKTCWSVPACPDMRVPPKAGASRAVSSDPSCGVTQRGTTWEQTVPQLHAFALASQEGSSQIQYQHPLP